MHGRALVSRDLTLTVLMDGTSPWARETVRVMAADDVVLTCLAVLPSGASAPEELIALEQVMAVEPIQCSGRPLPRIGKLVSVLASHARPSGAGALLTLYGGAFAAAAYLSRMRPYFVYAVGSDVLKVRPRTAGLARRALTAATRVFANGIELGSATRRLAPQAVVRPLYLGIDVAAYPVGTGSGSRPVILCTRAFEETYNNALVVDACAARPEILERADIVFSNKGSLLPDVVGVADRRLPKATRPAMHFLGGVSRRQLLDRLRTSAIYVSTARSDGTSTSLLEALVTGAYPVVTDIEQNREWIDPGDPRLGRLVDPDSPEELGNTLVALLDSGTDLREFGGLRRELVVERADSRSTMRLLCDQIAADVLTA